MIQTLEELLPAPCARCEHAGSLRRALTSRFIAGRVLRAQEDERARVARELHDETGQALTLMLLRLRMLHRTVTDAVARGELDDLHALVGDTLEAVRRLAADLGPTMLRDLGLGAALAALAARVRTEAKCELELAVPDEPLPVSDDLALALYRVAQEALTNVLRHSHARHARVRLARTSGDVRLEVADDGVGFVVPDVVGANSVGLFGMRERIELLGGTLEIRSAPLCGTTVSAVVRA